MSFMSSVLAASVLMAGMKATSKGQETVSRVGLFGGSSVRTSYLPAEVSQTGVLQRELEMAYAGQRIEVINYADNGEFIARYLVNGGYERHRKEGMEGIDIAIIRFGANDQKRFKLPEYQELLRKFVALLESDFPGIRIIMETGMYLDYPAHYSSDRNKVLGPYWNAARVIAEERGWPLADVYGAAEAATKEGNWDLRIRSSRPPKGKWVFDSSEDEGKDIKWFTDIHPNPQGVKVTVAEQVRVLKATFPERLPAGNKAAARAPRGSEEWCQFLGITPDQLEIKKKKLDVDDLQKASGGGAVKG